LNENVEKATPNVVLLLSNSCKENEVCIPKV
jgi:hypothetical protein